MTRQMGKTPSQHLEGNRLLQKRVYFETAPRRYREVEDPHRMSGRSKVVPREQLRFRPCRHVTCLRTEALFYFN